jgi:hypothetical protein
LSEPIIDNRNDNNIMVAGYLYAVLEKIPELVVELDLSNEHLDELMIHVPFMESRYRIIVRQEIMQTWSLFKNGETATKPGEE